MRQMRWDRHPQPAPHHTRSHPERPRARAFAAALLAAAMIAAPSSLPPGATAAPAAPKAYVGLFGDNAVAVIDTSAGRVVKTIPIPAGPDGIVVSPDGTRVYASSSAASTVSVISTATDRVVSNIEVGKAPNGLAITPDGRRLLVAVFGDSRVAVVDTVRNQVVAQIPVGNPHTIAVGPNGTTAYVTVQQTGAAGIAILDLATRTVTAMVPVDKTPRDLNLSPDGTLAYFTLAGVNAVQVFDTRRKEVVGQIPVGASPHIPLFLPNGRGAVVVVQGPGELTDIDTVTRQVTGSVSVGKFPHWVAITSDGRTAYVTNEGAGSVSVVSLDQQRVLATIPVGRAPRKIVVQPGPAARTNAAPPAGSSPVTAGPAVIAEAPAPGHGVHIANFAFAPQTLEVTTGTVVTWTNADSVPHTTTSTDKRWDSGPVEPGASFSVTFSQAGTYQYICAIHPYMKGTVIVTR